jgi:molecular chaperone GrpE (heat shock protein)
VGEVLRFEDLEAEWQANEGDEQATRVPVFVAPKPTDKGFYKRRMAQLEFARRQMQVSSDMAKVQAEMERVQRAAANETDPARQTELAEQSFQMLDKLDDLLAAQAAFVDEQIDFLLPFVRAINELKPSGVWGYRPRPYAAEEQDAFDEEVRELLRESSQEEFDAMLKAASGQGATPAVPPT